MKRKSIYKMMGKTAFVLSAITMFGGCGTKDTSTESSNPIVTMETVATESEDTQASDEVIESVDTKVSDEEKESTDTQASDAGKESTDAQASDEVKESNDKKVSDEVEESTDTDAENKGVTATGTGRKDGERFETTIMIEGTEDTVQYEHVINEEIGFELDYECDSLVREKGAGVEKIISIYDDASQPDNYLEVTYSKESAEDAAKSISEELSKEYEILQESCELNNAGSSITLVTTTAKEDCSTPSRLQKVYIIPTSEGSLIATSHYTLESAEGFGHRFSYIVNTIVPIKKN